MSASPRAAWAVVAAAVPVRLALALATDLSPDEAYYLCAAQPPSWLPPLVDHPPLLPWLLGLTGGFASWPVELRVRCWPMAFSLALGAALVVLARRRGAGPEGCILAAWLGNFALLPLAGGFVATPDGPALLAIVAVLAWAAGPACCSAGTSGHAAATGHESRTGHRSGPGHRELGLALGVGLLAAAGSLAKVVVLPIALPIVLIAHWQAWQARLLAILPMIASVPLLLPSLGFQLRHAFAPAAATSASWSGGWSALQAGGALASAIIAQALLWSPWVLWRGFRTLGQLSATDRAVVWVVSPLVVASALFRAAAPEPNWWAPAALVVVLGAARSARELTSRGRTALLAMVLAPTFVAAPHALHPYLPLPIEMDPTARLHGWSRGAAPIQAPGIGPYGPAAERCVYNHDCDEIRNYFNQLNIYSSSFTTGTIRR